MRRTYAQFIGREDDLARATALVETQRVVTLCGPGGVGKTRIVEMLVPVLAGENADEVVVVRLEEIADPGLVGHAVASAVGFRGAGDPGNLTYLADHLGDRRLSLVLDNCEHVVEAVAVLVAAVVEQCPHVRFVGTSQIPLGIAAEVVYPVRPLALPQGEPDAAAETQAPALAMFADRARSAVPSFRVTDENIATLTAVVQALEGLPLAIELAAARLRVLSPDALLERLSDRFAVLGQGFRDAPDRHRSLMASIAWIDELCTPAERALWSRLSVFTGGFSLVDAELVCAEDAEERSTVLDVLSALVDKSVVVPSEDDDDRFRMLESIREYGASRLASTDEVARWRDRHLLRFTQLAVDLREQWVGPDQAAWLQRLEVEGPNVRTALDHALADPATVPVALRICFDLQAFWATQGRSGEARYWLDRALAPDLGTPTERALACAMSASMALRLGDLAHARAMVDRGRAAAAGTDEDLVVGALCIAEGQVHLWELDIPGGQDLLREAVRRFRGTPRRYEHTASLVLVGMMFTQLGSLEEGMSMLDEAVRAGEETGESTARSYAQIWLALHAILDGDAVKADRLLHSGLELAWTLRDQIGIALQLEAAAHRALRAEGEPSCALLLGAAAAQWRRMDIEVSRQRVPGIESPHFAYRSTLPLTCPTEFAEGLAMTAEDAVRLAFDSGKDPDAVDDVPEEVEASPVLAPLSRRESEVAVLVAEGLSNRDIATRLFISERTAQGHVQSSLRKLDFGSRAQIAAWVVRLTL